MVPRLRSEGSGCHMSLISVGDVLAMDSCGGALGTVGCNTRCLQYSVITRFELGQNHRTSLSWMVYGSKEGPKRFCTWIMMCTTPSDKLKSHVQKTHVTHTDVGPVTWVQSISQSARFLLTCQSNHVSTYHSSEQQRFLPGRDLNANYNCLHDEFMKPLLFLLSAT